ncbi:hypothetical protein CEXT_491571 [Caerostris extrusa]|uniref:Uncharacterized protein n=1 Tax=Caerostris extrusa TaxID=172846 RepID=A0AAV4SE10_CAEEX|nr:hypothetical protein CEXT_491571 [Caerostris extrusa]
MEIKEQSKGLNPSMTFDIESEMKEKNLYFYEISILTLGKKWKVKPRQRNQMYNDFRLRNLFISSPFVKK